jgi:transaldolase/glucose-6-phosphate isomerase
MEQPTTGGRPAGASDAGGELPQDAVNVQELRLGGHARIVMDRLQAWDRSDLARRIWRKDPTVWDPGAAPLPVVPDLTDRLGWLTIAHEMIPDLATIADFAAAIRQEGYRHVVLLGMGGSSMAPEVFMATFGAGPGHPSLVVLDSTNPQAVQAVMDRVDLAKTLFIVSSKSGGTIETLSFYRFFFEAVGKVSANPGDHFITITDPGSKLEALAGEHGHRLVFSSPPEVGGRYSALTYFGLVPAALIGVDVGRLVGHALVMTHACAATVPASENPALTLGAALGELATFGRDKVTFFISPAIATLGVWMEQLIAESTGKSGTGILPVVDEDPAPPEFYGSDRLFVYLRLTGDDNERLDAAVARLEAAGFPLIRIELQEKEAIGQEFFRWELATAAAGAALAINPFNQPNVEAAKVKARKLMQVYREEGRVPAPKPLVVDGDIEVYGQSVVPLRSLVDALGGHLKAVEPGDYLALMAYVPSTPAHDEQLHRLRMALRDHLRVATTVGYGPRFLHSTGQLHKGDGNKGVFLQITHEPSHDLPIPGEPYSFGVLLAAQALGDSQALQEAGRRLLRLHIRGDLTAGLARVKESVR